MHRVEGDVVDGVDILKAAGNPIGAVTFERKVIFRVNCVHILNGNSALHATQSKA